MTLDRVTVLAGVPNELGAFGDLVQSVNGRHLGNRTRCDGWTVADVAGHVVGTVVDITEGRLEGQGTPAVTERQAKERAGHSGQQLADELARATPALSAILGSLPEDAWDGPSIADPRYPLGFTVEAIWFDAYLHGDDIRAAIGTTPMRGPGLRCAVHHVAGQLQNRSWGPATLVLDGIEPIRIAGGGTEITGDPLEFVLAATGRRDPTDLGFDRTVNVYAG
jgi:uncharacterized protein (TIGR03083 family)